MWDRETEDRKKKREMELGRVCIVQEKRLSHPEEGSSESRLKARDKGASP